MTLCKTLFNTLWKNFFAIGIFSILVTSPLSASSTDGSADQVVENPLTASLRFEPTSLPAGGNGTLHIDFNLVEHHKAYVDMLKLKFKNPAQALVGNPTIKPTFVFQDKFSKKDREAFKNHATLSASFEIPEATGDLHGPAEVDLTYQVCSDNYCLFPKTITLAAPLKIISEEPQLKAGDNFAETSPTGFRKALSRGKLFTFLFVFFAGVLTSLTPCIFPMIPITLAVIGARAAGHSKFKSFTMSLFYVGGIALTYSLLGLLAARTGALFGSLLGSPRVITGIALVFVAMGLSMYGVFEIKLPHFISHRLASKKNDVGFLGAFITGLITGIVASPCVGPVLVAILTYVAETQNMVFGFFLLLTFALGMGQLFLILGTFSGLIKNLPRSGPWMEVVKFLFGTTMIAAALYYIFPIAPTRLFEALTALALILISGAYGAFLPNQKLDSYTAKLHKALMFAAFLLGVILAAHALLGSRLLGSWTQTSLETQNASGNNLSRTSEWRDFSEELLHQALREKKPVIIDFWADWCISCKELEARTFTDPSVLHEGKGFVLLRLDSTQETEVVKKQKLLYHILGLPAIIFYDTTGKMRSDLTLTGFENAAAFLRRMQLAEH